MNCIQTAYFNKAFYRNIPKLLATLLIRPAKCNKPSRKLHATDSLFN